MKSELLKLLRNRISTSDTKFNRRVFVFFICLVISFFSWLQINLSKKQIENIPVQIHFVNLPKVRFGSAKITDTLYLEVEADGYDLIKYKMKEVDIDFRKLKKDKNPEAYFFLPNSYIKTMSKQLGENIKVLRAVMDTIQINPVLR